MLQLCQHKQQHQQGTTHFLMDTAETAPASPYAAEQPADWHATRARYALNRAVPATKRQRKLQALAVAVADELELRQRVDEQLNAEYAAADNLQQEAEQRAKDAALAAAHPLEAAFNEATGYREDRWISGLLHPEGPKAYKAERVLEWAIAQGILPQGTPALPDVEAQFLALAQWRAMVAQNPAA